MKKITLGKAIIVFLLAFAGNLPLCVKAENDIENHERWYQVEMLIFSRTDINKTDESKAEKWPTDIKLAYPASAIPLRTFGEGDSAISLLTPSLLTAQATTIAKNPAYTILFHQAWRERITARRVHLAISGGKTFNGHQELEGSIALNVGQYLILQTNLWLTHFAPTGTSVDEAWPVLPTLKNSDAALATNALTATTNDAVVTRIVKINAQRSMRSNEVHYIDHPLLGIMVKIIPVN